MIFDKNYDMTLWFMLSSDNKSKKNIASLISFLPKNIYEEIQNAVSNYSENIFLNIGEKIVFSKSFDGLDGFGYFVNIKFVDDNLTMMVRRWKEDVERLEEDYELTLSSVSNINSENFCEYNYIGSYSHEFSKIKILKNGFLTDTELWERDYFLLGILFGHIIGSKMKKYLFKIKIVNVSKKMPDEIYLDDFSSSSKINDLVKKRKRKRRF